MPFYSFLISIKDKAISKNGFFYILNKFVMGNTLERRVFNELNLLKPVL